MFKCEYLITWHGVTYKVALNVSSLLFPISCLLPLISLSLPFPMDVLNIESVRAVDSMEIILYLQSLGSRVFLRMCSAFNACTILVFYCTISRCTLFYFTFPFFNIFSRYNNLRYSCNLPDPNKQSCDCICLRIRKACK